jgi:hypothetical protein
VQAVMRDLSSVVRGRFERDEPTDTRVAEMTPVSSTGRLVQPLEIIDRLLQRTMMTYSQKATH